jgi:peptidoglycan/xylan/chitin deacetylase (PgdA/CDA1 family)
MSGGLAVLIYHRVGSKPDPLRPRAATAEEFRRQMRVLRRFFRPVALQQGMTRLRAGTLPARAVAVTFDDGYMDNVQVALPILREQGIPATFFIATSYLDGGRMWNDTVIEAVRRLAPGEHEFPHAGIERIVVPHSTERRSLALALLGAIKHLPQPERQQAAVRLAEIAGASLPDDLMMRRQDVRVLVEAGMDVGGHTRTHPILSGLTAAQAEQEIAGGLDELASITGRRPMLFAYPNGRRGLDYGDREVELLRRMRIGTALVTNRGIVTRRSDPLQAPRLTPLHRHAGRFGIALWRAYSEPEWLPPPDGTRVDDATAIPGANG